MKMSPADKESDLVPYWEITNMNISPSTIYLIPSALAVSNLALYGVNKLYQKILIVPSMEHFFVKKNAGFFFLHLLIGCTVKQLVDLIGQFLMLNMNSSGAGLKLDINPGDDPCR